MLQAKIDELASKVEALERKDQASQAQIDELTAQVEASQAPCKGLHARCEELTATLSAVDDRVLQLFEEMQSCWEWSTW